MIRLVTTTTPTPGYAQYIEEALVFELYLDAILAFADTTQKMKGIPAAALRRIQNMTWKGRAVNRTGFMYLVQADFIDIGIGQPNRLFSDMSLPMTYLTSLIARAADGGDNHPARHLPALGVLYAVLLFAIRNGRL